MSEILSQNEIDALLNAMLSGEPAAEEPAEAAQEELNVKPYDFKLAKKFSKEQMRTINIVYDTFGQFIGTYLTGAMRSVCAAEVVSIEETSFFNFANSVPEPAMLAIFNMPPLEGSCLIEVKPAIVYAVISHLFGGTDALVNTSKPFTEIEIISLTRIIKQLLRRMGEAWGRVVDVNPSLERMETSAQFAQIVSPNDAIAIITLNVTIGGVSDFINICIPHIAIEPIAKQLSTKLWFSGSAKQEIKAQPEKIKTSLLNSKLKVQAVFNDTAAALRDILYLQVGDVIQLNHSVKDPINIKLEHMLKFKGYIGTFNKSYAIKIDEIIKEAPENE